MSGDDNNVKLNICFLFFFALHKIAFYFDDNLQLSLNFNKIFVVYLEESK